MPMLSLLLQFWLYFLRFLAILILLTVQMALGPSPSSLFVGFGVFFMLNDLGLYVYLLLI